MSRLAKADRIVVGELTANLLGAHGGALVVKGKIVSTRSGASFGSMTFQNWSPTVLKKFKELLEVMEADMEAAFFDEEGHSVPAPTKDEGGLSEHLDGDEVAPPG